MSIKVTDASAAPAPAAEKPEPVDADALSALTAERDRLREALEGLERYLRETAHHNAPEAAAARAALEGTAPSETGADRLSHMLTRAVTLIDAMLTNDPGEPVSDGGHTALDLWRHEFEQLRASLNGGSDE